MLQVIEDESALKAARDDANRLSIQVATIEESIKLMNETNKNATEVVKRAKELYEEATKDFEEEYQNITQQNMKELKRNVTERYEEFNAAIRKHKKEQEDLFEETITTLKSRMHEIELANVNQTIASVKLTSDFCDAKFFLTFDKCYNEDMDIGTKINMTALEKKLIRFQNIIGDMKKKNLQLITDEEIIVKDDKAKGKFPIKSLFKNNVTYVDLEEYLPKIILNYPRLRLSRMNVQLLNNVDEVLTNDDEGVTVDILVPSLFEDIDTNSSRYQFISSSFGCRSRYSSKGVLKEFCQLSSHSVENKFYEIQPTPRGVFTFTLISPPKNVTEMTSLKILFSGSYKKKGKRRQRENKKE